MDKIETTPVGSRRHSYVGRKGDLRVELHYADPHPHCGREACLYVFRANHPTKGALIPFCQMWAYDTRSFGLTARSAQIEQSKVVELAGRTAAHIYPFVTQSDTFRVLDVMAEYMQDLQEHLPETGLDSTLDEWLADAEDQGLEFFAEVNGERIIG